MRCAAASWSYVSPKSSTCRAPSSPRFSRSTSSRTDQLRRIDVRRQFRFTVLVSEYRTTGLIKTPQGASPKMASVDASRDHILTPIPLTRQSILPFGDVISSEGIEPVARTPGEEAPYGGTIDGYRGGLVESKEPVELIMPPFRVRECRVLFMERHPEFSQTYIPVTA